MSRRYNQNLFVQVVQLVVYPVVCILSLVANAVMWIVECALLELGGPGALDDVSTEIGDPGRGMLVIVRSEGIGTWSRRPRHPALNVQLIQRFDRIVCCALNLLFTAEWDA